MFGLRFEIIRLGITGEGNLIKPKSKLNMKTLSILTLIIGLSATCVFAQEDPTVNRGEHLKKERKDLTPEEIADKRTAKMTELLGLTADQQEKIRAINLEHAREMQKLHEEMKALKTKMKEEREKAKSEVDTVLTDEQKVKLEEEHQKRKAEHEQKRKERCCQEKN